MSAWAFTRQNLLPVVAVVLLAGSVASASDEKLDYNFHIRPILADRCFICHGPDEKARKGKLRLDTRGSVLARGAIVPGKPEASVLIQRITATDHTRMPPARSNLHLDQHEVGLLRRWIAEGAEYKPHWAFIPLPSAVPVPAVSDPTWPNHAIDQFVLARLDREGLKPSPAVTREDWIRRVTFGLTGLPPTPAEVDAFRADTSPRAFEQVADRLLRSHHFGERLAMDWLDVARYADSFGYQSDADTHVWPWRDWVIEAFNDNLPFDQFLTWQLAGDLLPNASRQQRLATAFCRLNRMTGEGGSIAEEYRQEYVSDRVHTVGTAFLGLTFECTRCHDHKYDPLTMKDYYGLGAFFNSIDEWGLYDNPHYRPTPTLPLPTAEQEKLLSEQSAAVARQEARLREVEQSREPAFQSWLARGDLITQLPGRVGHYPLDRIGDKQTLENLANAKNPGSTSPANVLVAGKSGQALKFTGDDSLQLPNVAGSLDRTQPFTVSFWLQVPQKLNQAVIFHRQSGTDTGFHGTELTFDDGKLSFAMVRFWPGNAMAVRTQSAFPTGDWVHVTARYDGSGKASGLRLFLNGKPVESQVIRDQLSKNLEAGTPRLTYFSGGNGIVFGERFRSIGLKDCLLDEVQVFERDLSDLEIAQLHDGKTLTETLARRDAGPLRAYYLSAIDSEVAKARDALRQARQQLFSTQTAVFEIMTMAELPQPRPAFILARGDYDGARDKPVGRLTPESLLPFPDDAPHNRLGLARWLTDPRHPLTARVAVNRLWQLIFGHGLVGTTENFGQQGTLPTHPELLDWLARDFISSGWDVKRLCKQMVLSSTYRQRSAASPTLRERDPENLLYARGPSRRLSAEMLRDTSLFVGDLLVKKLGGPPVRPYQPAGLWRGQNSFLPEYVQDKGEGLHRRSLYTFWRRTSPPPNMLAFDMPAREVCVARRQSTSTPMQPLVLLNDPQFVEAARGLAERMLRQPDLDLEARLRFAFRAAATRSPSQREVQILTELYAAQLALFRKQAGSAQKYLQTGSTPPAKELDLEQLAAATVTASAILNLDAAVMVR